MSCVVDETLCAEMRKPSFRNHFFSEAVSQLVSGDFEVGLTMLRQFLSASNVWTRLAAALKLSPQSLEELLAPGGNPPARVLFAAIALMQRGEAGVLKMRFIEHDPTLFRSAVL